MIDFGSIVQKIVYITACFAFAVVATAAAVAFFVEVVVVVAAAVGVVADVVINLVFRE